LSGEKKDLPLQSLRIHRYRPDTAEAKQDRTPQAFDPLANFHAQEQKRKDWKYPAGPPDESKLI
jgi:hypothetical protein